MGVTMPLNPGETAPAFDTSDRENRSIQRADYNRPDLAIHTAGYRRNIKNRLPLGDIRPWLDQAATSKDTIANDR